MGGRTIRTLGDLARLGDVVRVTCPRCGRSASFALVELMNYFQQRGWNLALEDALRRFRCAGVGDGDRGCGRRGARLAARELTGGTAPPLPLEAHQAK
jgi:hypothetical protein